MELGQRFWEDYGLGGNPYETLPLSTNARSILPIFRAFVGRSSESLPSREITGTLGNPGGGRLVVEGEIGVGKTTFVNYHRYLWEHHAQDRLFSPVHEIPIYPEWSVQDVLINLLCSLTNKFLLSGWRRACPKKASRRHLRFRPHCRNGRPCCWRR